MVVWWHELGEVENECTSHNFSLFAIFLPKIIKIGGMLTTTGKTILHSFVRHGVDLQGQAQGLEVLNDKDQHHWLSYT